MIEEEIEEEIDCDICSIGKSIHLIIYRRREYES